jgi:HTH-type transcriptional regulator, glycine betaine synthesis regulator
VNDSPSVVSPLQDLEMEVLEFFVRGAQLLGLPRSMGEIYGLLYLSTEPLSMEQIVQRLKISTGSASQGLKQLRGFRAVRTVYVPGERRDYYVAEEELRKVLTGFVQEEIRPHLESGRERLARMDDLAAQLADGEHKEMVEFRIKRLLRLHALFSRLLPAMMRFVKV